MTQPNTERNQALDEAIEVVRRTEAKATGIGTYILPEMMDFAQAAIGKMKDYLVAQLEELKKKC